MTPRQRILSAIDHREPDRVPVDLGATPSSGISATAYGRLKAHLDLQAGHTRIYDVVQQLAQPEESILDRFGVDVLDIGRAFNERDEDWCDIRLANGDAAQYPTWFRPVARSDGSFDAELAGETIARMPAGGTFFDQTCFPYLDGYPETFESLDDAMGRVLWAALVHSPWDHAGETDFWEQLRARTLRLRESSDRALMVVCGCNLFEWGTFLRRMDNFLMDLFTAPADVGRLLDALMERHLATLEKVCRAVGDICDILRFGDDLGMDSGPFMPPELYRTLFKPRHRQLCEYVHSHSGMKTFLHSCGSIYELLPDLIEAGYDVINPVQTNCRDMEPRRLKDEFGADITFWGGTVDPQKTLARGTPEEVHDEAVRRITELKPGGGFVIASIHNMQAQVPVENILAFWEAVEEAGTYG